MDRICWPPGKRLSGEKTIRESNHPGNDPSEEAGLLLMEPTWNHSIGCAKSSTTQLMSLTAKVVKLSGIFSKLQSESEKLKKKLENCEAYNRILGLCPFRHYSRSIRLVLDFQSQQWTWRHCELGCWEKIDDAAHLLVVEILKANFMP